MVISWQEKLNELEKDKQDERERIKQYEGKD